MSLVDETIDREMRLMESSATTTRPSAFSISATRATTCRVVLLHWSPIHDVAAVVFDQGPLTLYRLPWKRVWALNRRHRPTALRWSPNGLYLAIGYDDGDVECVAKETGVTLFSFSFGFMSAPLHKMQSDGVASLGWARLDAAVVFKKEGLRREQHLFNEIPAETSKQIMTTATLYEQCGNPTVPPPAKNNARQSLRCEDGMICVAAKSGQIGLFLTGKILIASFRALSDDDNHDIIASEVTMLKDAETLLVILLLRIKGKESTMEAHNSATSSSATIMPAVTESSALQLLTCDCRVIGKNFDRIATYASGFSRVLTLLSDAEKSLTNVHEMWSGTLKAYIKILESDDTTIDVLIDELTIFLGLHVIGSKLKAIIEKEWTKLWLQRASHQLDVSLHHIADILNTRIRVQLQSALVAVDELQGLSNKLEIMAEDTFNLKSERLQALRARLILLVLRVDAVYNRLHEVGKGYRLLLCLILFVRQVLEHENIEDPNIAENTQLLLDFMDGELRNESLLAEFSAPVGSEIPRSQLHRQLQSDAVHHAIAVEIIDDLDSDEAGRGLRTLLIDTLNFVSRCLTDIQYYLSTSVTRTYSGTLCGNFTRPVSIDFALCPVVDEGVQFLCTYNSKGAGRLRHNTVDGILVVRGIVGLNRSALHCELEQAIVLLPQNQTIAGLSFWGCDRVLALVRSAENTESELVSVDLSCFVFVRPPPGRRSTKLLPEEIVNTSKHVNVHLDTLSIRRRSLAYTSDPDPFVCSTTGMMAIVAGQRIVILNLNKDETTS